MGASVEYGSPEPQQGAGRPPHESHQGAIRVDANPLMDQASSSGGGGGVFRVGSGWAIKLRTTDVCVCGGGGRLLKGSQAV